MRCLPYICSLLEIFHLRQCTLSELCTVQMFFCRIYGAGRQVSFLCFFWFRCSFSSHCPYLFKGCWIFVLFTTVHGSSCLCLSVFIFPVRFRCHDKSCGVECGKFMAWAVYIWYKRKREKYQVVISFFVIVCAYAKSTSVCRIIDMSKTM